MKKNTNQTKYKEKLWEQLAALKLDATYIRAKGDFLYRETEDGIIEILDLVGAYGANLLGHFHPKIQNEIILFLKKQHPVFAQAAISKATVLLNKKLQEMFGDYRIFLINTGAETVEAAIKHAHLENGKTHCWAIKNAYHGKSIGTLAFSPRHNQSFQFPTLNIDFLDPIDEKTWATALENVEEVSFAIIEPIQGEGGVLPIPKKFVEWLNETTQKYKIPIIADEIQTGLGRTGKLLASEHIGLRTDYICLSKALGGGFCKIGALLIQNKRFIPEFSLLHTSTFGDDGLSSSIATKVLDIIREENIPAKCAEVGAFIKKELLKIKKDFPNVIKEVRGEGLMIGLAFHHQKNSPSNLLRILSETHYFGYVIAGYFLNVWRVRIMPTLSNPFTLRIQPSAYIQATDFKPFLSGLREICTIIEKADAAYLLGFLINRFPKNIGDYRNCHHFKHEKPLTSKKVAFLGHLIHARDVVLWDKSLERWTETELENLIDRCARLFEPAIFDQINVQTPHGQTVHLSFIGLFLTSRQIEKAWRERDFLWIIEKIQKAVEIAEQAGCQVLGLGGFTSILTKNGMRLKTQKLQLTTGNSLTVGMGIEAICEAMKAKNLKLEETSIAIVGIGGNIANTYAMLLAAKVKKMYLIPRQRHNKQVKQLTQQLQQEHPLLQIKITDQLETLQHCDVIISASNSSKAIIFPEHLSARTAIICDLAVPADVDESVGVVFPQTLVIKGGIIRLPEGNDFVIGGIPLDKGHVFACMGETVLMGLDEMENFKGSVGAIEVKGVERCLELAREYGFELGALKRVASY